MVEIGWLADLETAFVRAREDRRAVFLYFAKDP